MVDDDPLFAEMEVKVPSPKDSNSTKQRSQTTKKKETTMMDDDFLSSEMKVKVPSPKGYLKPKKIFLDEDL